jgi:hypothetical protein
MGTWHRGASTQGGTTMTEDVNIDPKEIAAFARLVAHLANSRLDGDVYERLHTAMREAFATLRRHTPLMGG